MQNNHHLEMGHWGETLATSYLEENGYDIIRRNYRYGRTEIDIIAWKGPILIFIEVKARSYDTLGKPETFVNGKKRSMIARGAAAFMEQIRHDGELRFDIISILKFKNGKTSLKHYPDAFFPGP
jgi:putative endonuclease